jgi:hypothetical protein
VVSKNAVRATTVAFPSAVQILSRFSAEEFEIVVEARRRRFLKALTRPSVRSIFLVE